MKDNKIIAEFMGMEHCYRPYDDGFMEVKENDSCVELEDLQYHTSWDWLMPVAEKCLTTGDRKHYVINDALLTCNIEEVYKAVVEFINEHNKYICGSCGDHVNEVVFNEDADVDECTNCTEYYER